MAIKDYTQESFIGKYIQECKVADVPLRDTQIQLLETILSQEIRSDPCNRHIFLLKCEEKGFPLYDFQLRALSSVVGQVFHVSLDDLVFYDEQLHTDNFLRELIEPLSRDAVEMAAMDNDYEGLETRIVNILNAYRTKMRGDDDGLPLCDGDAFSLYRLTAKEIGSTTFKDLKTEHDILDTYGWNEFGVVREYLKCREIVNYDTPLPKPIDMRG